MTLACEDPTFDGIGRLKLGQSAAPVRNSRTCPNERSRRCRVTHLGCVAPSLVRGLPTSRRPCCPWRSAPRQPSYPQCSWSSRYLAGRTGTTRPKPRLGPSRSGCLPSGCRPRASRSQRARCSRSGCRARPTDRQYRRHAARQERVLPRGRRRCRSVDQAAWRERRARMSVASMTPSLASCTWRTIAAWPWLISAMALWFSSMKNSL